MYKTEYSGSAVPQICFDEYRNSGQWSSASRQAGIQEDIKAVWQKKHSARVPSGHVRYFPDNHGAGRTRASICGSYCFTITVLAGSRTFFQYLWNSGRFMAFIRHNNVKKFMADPSVASAFQSPDDQMWDRGILFSQYPFTAANYLKSAFTPWTMGFFPAPHIKKSELSLRSNR